MWIRGLGMRRLLDWESNEPEENALYIAFCIALVLMAGCMSGLTLGLLSMDIVDLEVLIRSGSPADQQRAKNIVPIVKNAHYLLVTLLLCNAAAMETLPIFLDKMVDESVAIIISVTAVLMFGEIIPQAVCSKHGLMVGSMMALPVRFLMIVTAPISWPVSKVLDKVLGGDHASLFRRKQLRALVTIHAKDEGFGGKLTADEIQIITGAMDLTQKTAYMAMTGLEKVFMLSTTQKLDDTTVEAIMSSKPFSRLPVYRGENKRDIIGLILVKELLEYVKKYPDSPVSSLKIRPLPRLSASTPMYDMLKLFRTGRSHMALLTQPFVTEEQEQQQHARSSGLPLPGLPAPGAAAGAAGLLPAGRGDAPGSPRLLSDEVTQPLAFHVHTRDGKHPDPAPPGSPSAGQHHHHHHHHHHGSTTSNRHSHSLLAKSASAASVATPQHHHHRSLLVGHSPRSGARHLDASAALGFADQSAPTVLATQLGPGDQHVTVVVQDQACEESTTAMSVASKLSRSRSAMNSIKRFFRTSHSQDDHGHEGRGSSWYRNRSSSGSTASGSSDDDLDDLLPVPEIALPGEPIGIITIEDVIEELMQFEIVDETDRFVDNEQSLLVSDAKLEHDLPDNIRSVLSQAEIPQPDPQPQQPQQASRLASIMASVLWPSVPARSSSPGAVHGGASAPNGPLAAGASVPSHASGQKQLIAGMARDLFRTSKPQMKKLDSMELAPLLEGSGGVSAATAGGQQQFSEPGAGNPSSSLAAALLVAAGKRSPGLASALAGSHRPLPGQLQVAQAAKGSKELFSYLGPTQQHKAAGAPGAAAAAAKPADQVNRAMHPAEPAPLPAAPPTVLTGEPSAKTE